MSISFLLLNRIDSNFGQLEISVQRKELNLYEIFKEWESEEVNLKFCKYMLRVSKKCTNIAVLTELGRFLMYIDILKQMFMYLHRLEHSPSNLLNRVFSEYKNNTNQDSNSWYFNLLLYSKKINIDLEVCKD